MFKKRYQLDQEYADRERAEAEARKQANFDRDVAIGKIGSDKRILFALTGSSLGEGKPPAGAEGEYAVTLRQLREAQNDLAVANAHLRQH